MNTKTRSYPALLLAVGLSVAVPVQAALHDRGGGLIYDDVLDITWLQDANYAKTSGYDADGRMTWDQAQTWAANLNYGGFDDWRLPILGPVDGTSFDIGFSYDGTTDVSYNITGPHSEMSYMYYANLGLMGKYNPDTSLRTDWGIFGNATCNGTNCSSYGQNNVGLINNLQAFVYWSGVELTSNPDYVLGFLFKDGYQHTSLKNYDFYAWAVRSGDVAAVPEPEAYAMLLAGLGLVGMMARKGRRHVGRLRDAV